MKYSVLTIFLVTGYVALLLAGMQEEDTWWRHGATLAWFAMIAYLVVLACDVARPMRATFGRVALGCAVAYLAVSFLPGIPQDALPHQWFTGWYAPVQIIGFSFVPTGGLSGNLTPNIDYLTQRPIVVRTLSAMNMALLFGVVTGVVAVARTRKVAGPPE